MRKLVKGLVCAMLTLSLVGCGVDVSTKASKDEDYSDIFTDKEKGSGFYKNSFIAYNFSLGDLGETKVYVDTSEGHKFELQGEEGGFDIVDKKGNVVIYARAINDNAYTDFMEADTRIEKINGREFTCLDTTRGAVDAITRLDDVGIDIGFAMEAPSGDVSDFSLVAFRGEPVKSTYKKETKKENKKETKEDTESNKKSTKRENTNSTLNEKTQKAMDSLESDYGKVYWAVQYALEDDDSGVVASVTPFFDGYSHYLVLGITNLLDKDITVSANVQAKNKEDDEIGESMIYAPVIGTGSTYINVIYCGQEEPDGRIHWDNIEVEDSVGKFTPWEADYKVNGKKGEDSIKVECEMYAQGKEDLENADLTALLLDKDGFVIAYGTDYSSETIKAGEKGTLTATIYSTADVLAQAKDVAIFSNPIKF